MIYFGLPEQVEDSWGCDCVTISGAANVDVREWYAENQMSVIVYFSLRGGFFSGKFKSCDYDAARKVLNHAGQNIEASLLPLSREDVEWLEG